LTAIKTKETLNWGLRHKYEVEVGRDGEGGWEKPPSNTRSGKKKKEKRNRNTIEGDCTVINRERTGKLCSLRGRLGGPPHMEGTNGYQGKKEGNEGEHPWARGGGDRTHASGGFPHCGRGQKGRWATGERACGTAEKAVSSRGVLERAEKELAKRQEAKQKQRAKGRGVVKQAEEKRTYCIKKEKPERPKPMEAERERAKGMPGKTNKNEN